MQGPRVWIIMEYAEGGSIRTLVRVFVLCTVYHLLLTSKKIVSGATTERTSHLPRRP